MKIIELRAENIKRLHAVEIKPDGNVVVISGRNGQGKTSVLDSIWMALGGAKAAPPKPIREGESEASVTLDLGDFTVTRKWKGATSSLSVMSNDGMKPSSPQRFLDERLGALSFDPLAFAQDDPKKQLATLLNLVELPFDLDEMAAKRRKVYEERTEVGRLLATAQAALAGLGEVPEGTPQEEVSVAVLLAKKDEYEAQVRLVVASEGRVLRARERVLAAEESLRLAEIELNAAKFDYEDATDSVVESPEPVDFSVELASIEATNAAVRLRHEREVIGTQVGQLTLQQRNLTGEIERLDHDKSDALAKAQMPIEGLGFDEDGVTYNGVPFSQSSGAEQLRVSVAMAMALNPDIRVIRISDGSLLDSTNMALIAEMADEHDFQVWIEVVDESGHVGFVIEDGEIVA